MTDKSENTNQFRPYRTLVGALRRTSLIISLACLSAGQGSPDLQAVTKSPATSQLEFGVKVALKGSWNEAAFRFQRAIDLGGGSPRVFNNLAVAQESLGHFEKAQASYEKALSLEKAGSEDLRIRENYERLLNFLKSSHPASAAP